MKNILNTLLILSALFFVGCAGGGGGNGAAAPAGPVDDGVYDYTYKLTGSVDNIQYALDARSNFGDADETTVNTGIIMLQAGGQEYYFTGRNFYSSLTLRSAGTITIEVYKDGVLIDTAQISNVNTSIYYTNNL